MVHRTNVNRISHAVLRGRVHGGRDGYASGYAYGYHLARCQSVLNTYPSLHEERRHVRILYVEEGSPGFTTIDLGIQRALSILADEVVIVRHYEDAISLAESVRPDLVLVLNGISAARMAQIQHIRERGYRTAVWLMDDPYFTDITAGFVSLYDYIFTYEAGTVDFYRQLGCSRAYYLPAAACPETVRPQFVEPGYRADVTFIGTAFANRIEFFNKVTPALVKRKVRLFIAGRGWDRLKDWEKLKSSIDLRGVLYDHNIRHYLGSRLVINLHRSEGEKLNSRRLKALSPNPRTFEVAACGTLQLTDVREELPRFYEPGSEIDTFGSPEEIVDKIIYYMSHEDRRSTVALNGLYKTLQSHTYVHRVKELLGAVFG